MVENGSKWWQMTTEMENQEEPAAAQRQVIVSCLWENHTVDPKGRLIVPAKFREQLGDEFVVTKGLDGCLFVYTSEEWHNIEEKFRNISMTSKDARKFSRFFFAGAASCELDKQGRILLPPVLREYANLTKDVVLVGVLSRVEIWDKDRWQENTYDEDEMDEIAEHMADLGFSI